MPNTFRHSPQKETFLESCYKFAKSFIDETSDAVIAINPDLQIIFWNPSAERIFGSVLNEAGGHSIWNLLQRNVGEGENDQILQELVQTGFWSGETIHRGHNGRIDHFWTSITSITDSQDRQVGFITINRDITSQKQEAVQLARYRLLFEHGRDIILFVRFRDGQILEANLAAEQAYGYSREELLSLKITDLRAPETLSLVGSQMQQADSSGILFKTVHRRKDASTFPVEVSSLGTDVFGERVNLSIIRDIAARVRSEAQLRESEERYRLLFENAVDAVLLIRDHTFVECNTAALTLFGAPRQAVLGAYPWQFSPPNQSNGRSSEIVAREKIATALAGQTITFDWIHRRLDGSDRVTEVRLSPIELNGSKHLQVIIRDITERQQAEEEIRRLTHLYAVLSQVNQAIVRVKSRPELFDEICRVAVEFGDFPLAWIGAPDPLTQRAKPLAQAGHATDYLNEALIFADDRPEGRRPFGIAFREGRSVIANAFETDPSTEPWRKAASRFSFTAAGAFPLFCGGAVCAVFVLYSNQTGFFNEDEVRLLEEVADNISFALSRFSEEERCQQAEEDLRKSEERYRALVELDPDTVFVQVENRFAFINKAGLQLFGFDHPEQIIGQLVIDHIHPEFRSLAIERIYQLNEARLPVPRIEEAFLRSDGTAVMTEVEAVPIEYGGKQGALVLARDITERICAEQQLRESEERYRALVEMSPDGIGVVCDGKIDFINSAGLALFGANSSDQVIGKPIFDHLPHDDITIAHYVLDRVLQGEVLQSTEQTIFRVDGNPIIAEMRGAPYNQQGKRAALLIANDITARKQAEREIERRMVEMIALHEVALAGTESSNLDELILRVTKILWEKLYPTDFGIAFLDEQQKLLIYHPSSRTIEHTEPEAVPIGSGICGTVVMTGEPRRVADVRLDPDYIEIDPVIRSELCVPLHVGGSVIGVINVESTQLGAFNRADEQFLIAVAGELGTAIEKIRLLQAEQDRRRELELLQLVTQTVREAKSRDEILSVVLDQVTSLLLAQATAIAMKNEKTGEVVFDLTTGRWATITGLHMPPGVGVGNQVLVNRTPYRSEDIRSDPHVYRPDLFGVVQCLLCVPLFNNENVVGLLYIGRDKPILPAEERLTLAVGNIAASAIQRAQLHEQTQRQVERLTALRAIDQAILSTLDLQSILNLLLEQVTAQLGTDAAALLLYQPQFQWMEIAAGKGLRISSLQQNVRIRLGESHAGRAALERKLEYIPDLSGIHDELTAHLETAGEHFTSFVAFPLIAKDEIKGVLELFHRTQLDIDPEWVNLLETLGNQAAIAIDNAQLFSRQQQANLSLQIAYDDTIEGWSRALDLRDKETEGHTLRVTDLTLQLAQTMGIPEHELVHIRRGALLHDIGKMGIPDQILLKTGPLTEEEWEIMRRHPTYAFEMLSPIRYLHSAVDIPFCHHEKWDGTGYPRGLKGEDIPLVARIFAVVDVWDALTSDRPYRSAWSQEQALQYIQEQAGKHFDPTCVQAFIDVLRQAKRIADN